MRERSCPPRLVSEAKLCSRKEQMVSRLWAAAFSAKKELIMTSILFNCSNSCQSCLSTLTELFLSLFKTLVNSYPVLLAFSRLRTLAVYPCLYKFSGRYQLFCDNLSQICCKLPSIYYFCWDIFSSYGSRSESSFSRSASSGYSIFCRASIATGMGLQTLLILGRVLLLKMGLRLLVLRKGSYISCQQSPYRILLKSAPHHNPFDQMSYYLSVICWSRGERTDSMTSSWNISFTLVGLYIERLQWVLLKL